MTTFRLMLVTSIVIGIAIGIGAFTFVYAKGASYLGNDPATCANCHIMNEHYYAWQRSSHRSVATCNDCHTPANVVGKYATKAANGFWHSVAFTTGRFPDPLQIKDYNHEITENACRKCHAQMTREIDPHGASDGYELEDGGGSGDVLRCTRCHQYVGHWVR